MADMAGQVALVTGNRPPNVRAPRGRGCTVAAGYSQQGGRGQVLRGPSRPLERVGFQNSAACVDLLF
jgi:hypothetical protein